MYRLSRTGEEAIVWELFLENPGCERTFLLDETDFGMYSYLTNPPWAKEP